MDCRNKIREVNSRNIYLLGLHHTVTRIVYNKQDLDSLLNQIEVWHRKKPWAENRKTKGEFGYKYIAYNAVVGDGIARIVQDLKYIRYHTSDCCLGVNSVNIYGIAISLTGNFTNKMPSERQLATFVTVWGEIEKRYKLDLKIVLHRDQGAKCKAPTACPGNTLVDWFRKGGREKLIAWTNEYEKTGKLPFGYGAVVKWPYVYVKKAGDDLEGCQNKLKECATENITLKERVEMLEKELSDIKKQNEDLTEKNRDLTEKIHEQADLIIKLGGKIKVLEGELKQCQNESNICSKIKYLLVKLLKFIKEWLKNKKRKKDLEEK